MQSITLPELKVIFERVLSKLEFELGDNQEIIFERDFYGIIPTENWQDLYPQPVKFNVGSLYDDLESLKKLITNKERPCTYVDFDRLASVLREISQIQNPG